jgi:hypothetical protein
MPTVEPDVVQIVESMWGGHDDRLRVLAHLAQYGQEPYERERTRVQLAVLRLSQGQPDRIADLIGAAKRDYRDVLMWAEYPEEGRALWALHRKLSPEERTRLEEVRRRDKAQYESWLREARRRSTIG